MKIAVTGKGGVGKSTITALLARILSELNKEVILIDADPDMNLAGILGISDDKALTPIVELKDVIAERTGTTAGTPAPIFKLNPKVDDLPEKYWVDFHGIKFLIMGTIKQGGAGCACPENAFLKSFLSYLLINRQEYVILDMEAGIEHLGRGTAIGVEKLLVIVEPSKSSLDTAGRIKKLAGDIGIQNLFVIVNKIKSEDELGYVKKALVDYNVLGYINYCNELGRINMGLNSALTIQSSIIEEVKKIINEF